MERHNVQVRVLGEIQRLPISLQIAMARAVQVSRTNGKCILNVCFAYSATRELERAIDEIQRGIQLGLIMKS